MTDHRSGERPGPLAPVTVTRSLVSLEAVAGAQDEPGGNEDGPAEHRIDEGDNVRAGGDVREQKDGHRHRKEQSCKNKGNGECPATFTHALKQSLSERGVLHSSCEDRTARDIKTPVVEYCVNNCPSPDERFGADIEVRAMSCLERCGTCRTTPFLVVDGELHTAATHEDLREALSEVSP